MFQNVQLFAHFCVVFGLFFATFQVLITSKSCRFLMLSCTFRLVFDIATQKMETKSVAR